jgi:hypothetical protein
MQAGFNEFSPILLPNRITNAQIKNKKMNKENLAGTTADNSTKDDGLHVSPACIKHNVSGSRVLFLSLKKQPFDVMITGEKNEEFRKRSAWIMSRLYDNIGKPKHYDYIKFVNGYGNDKPYFICKYEGVFECYMKVTKHSYSNGLTVDGIGKGDFIILCGKIIERGNV